MANSPINKVQPMREAEQDMADYLNGTVAPYMVRETQERKDADAAEKARAEAAEAKLTADLNTEVARAKAAEKVLTDDLASEVTRAKAAEKVLTDDLASEVSRAKAAEGTNATAIATEAERATASESVLQTNITAENKRAVAAEEVLTGLYGDLAEKFPVQTENIGDAQVTEVKLASDIQTLLAFCKTLPAFEFGYSEAVSIPASGTTSVEITFNKAFDETPQVFTEVMCNTLNNILVAHVTYVDTTKATIKLYNGGVGQVDNVTVDYLALAGR